MEPAEYMERIFSSEETLPEVKNAFKSFLNQMLDIIDLYKLATIRFDDLGNKQSYMALMRDRFGLLKTSSKQLEYYFDEYAKLHGLNVEEVKAQSEIEMTVEKIILCINAELYQMLNPTQEECKNEEPQNNQ